MRFPTFAALAIVTCACAPHARADEPKFAWPAVGRFILGFCGRPDAQHDGINLAIRAGAEISAVGDGQVAYAGNELKGYRNLILIRHADGWISAYAGAGEVLVSRGDVVRRGQVIATMGESTWRGLHFELRHRSIPTDPLRYLPSSEPAREAGLRCVH
jgi:murein DD-endopeptidase MepM/ murein hydrolase activator NlpD